MLEHPNLTPEQMFPAEIAQLQSDGYDVRDLTARVEAALAQGLTPAEEEAFWSQLETLAASADLGEKPCQLEAVRQRRPAAARERGLRLSQSAYYDRVYGAWLGRCAGCTLGKPVEGWPRAKITAYLEAADAYPLTSYIPALDPFPEGLALERNYPGTTLGRIDRMVRDDDIDYTVLGLHILENHGPAFNSLDVASAWLNGLPFKKVYTAEAVAYRHLVNGVAPPESASRRNPYREWIGAQIRADMWGYVNPGDPERAAELAYRDASVSHIGNGIYGEMWAAACIAAAFGSSDPLEIVTSGLAEIPADCLLAAAVRDTLAWADQYPRWESAWDEVNSKYGHHATVHVVNNTCVIVIVLALIYGDGELGRSICLAVMGGWDTDCTGATVGSHRGRGIGSGGTAQ